MEGATEQGVLSNNFVVYTCIRYQPTMLLQTAVQQQLNQPIPPKKREKLSELQTAIDHKSVDVYLQKNFTVSELVQICEICHLRPSSHDKDVLIRHIERKMIKKNQHSILEIIEYVLSSANMTYHILGNTLTGLSVVVSSSVMVSMLNKLFRTDTSIFPSGSSSGPDSSSNASKTTRKATNMVFLMSLIFIASKNLPSMLKVMPNLRKHMKMHREIDTVHFALTLLRGPLLKLNPIRPVQLCPPLVVRYQGARRP